MTRAAILLELQQAYARQREENQREEQRRELEATARVPGLAQALEARRNLIYHSVQGILRHSGSYEDLPRLMAQQNQAVEALLRAGGYPADYLDPVYRCPKCRDTGYVGEPVREMCSCLQAELNRRMMDEIGLGQQAQQSFEAFDPGVFPEGVIPEWGITQRELMLRAKAQLEGWCQAYPATPIRTVLLSGSSGLGKTYLMHCMAKRLMERGVSVMLLGASRYLDIAKRASFSGDSTQLDQLMDCQVLMVDDLGCEPLMDNVTNVHIYNLVNDRLNAGSATVLSTNLTVREMKERYTERVASRLTDRQRSLVVLLKGEDVRRL